MWALLSSRLRTWLLITVVVPLIAGVTRYVATRIEQRRGANRLSRALHRVSDLGSRGRRNGRVVPGTRRNRGLIHR
jgi:hypothetical protein